MPDTDTTVIATETAATTTPKLTYVARAKALVGKINFKKAASVILCGSFAALLIVAMILVGLQVAEEVTAAKTTANQALAKATEANAAVIAVSDRVDSAEQGISLLAGENQAQDQKLVAFDGRLSLTEKAVTDVGKTATAAAAKADTANARQAARVKAENQNYRKMLAFVRGAAPDSALAQKSNAEVEKLLNDGAWNVEGEIQSEYNRLNAQATATAQQTATATACQLQEVDATANQALAAGNTAISAVKVIADQPNKLLGKSVTTNSKKTLKELVAAYSK